MRHVLFVCSKNKWRSPTAENLYRNQPGLSVRSRGTAQSAARRITSHDLEWADLVIVMEYTHQRRLNKNFQEEMRGKDIHVLHIADDYQYMDPELVDMLRDEVDSILAGLG